MVCFMLFPVAVPAPSIDSYVMSRFSLVTCTLLACWPHRPCSGFFGGGFLLSPAAQGQRSLQQQQNHRRCVTIDSLPSINTCARTSSIKDGSSRTRRATATTVTRMAVGSPAELWESYLGALEAAPLLTKSITAGLIFPAADATAQLFVKDDKEGGGLENDSASGAWDFARTLRWLFFGFAVQAPWNHFFYVFLDGVLPPTPDPLSTTTAIKVVIDQFIQAPIFTIIIFGVLGLLEGKTTADIRQQLDQDYKSTMLANWGVFVPAAIVNLAFCPPELRVLFLNVVFFAWTIYLSTIVSKGGGGGNQVAEEG